MADPTAVFRDTKVTNLHDIVNSIDKLNFMEDPTIDSIKTEIQTKLMGYNVHALRHDPELREQKGTEAQDIVRKMSVFMGTPMDMTPTKPTYSEFQNDLTNLTTEENV